MPSPSGIANDNIMGGVGGDEGIDIPVNLDPQFGRAAQDAAVLAAKVKEMRSDAEAYVNGLGSTSEVLGALIQKQDRSSTAVAGLLEIEKSLEDIRRRSTTNLDEQEQQPVAI